MQQGELAKLDVDYEKEEESHDDTQISALGRATS